MSGSALGMIETVGLAPAAAALDEALDTADIHYVGSEKVIGAGKSISVTIHFVGEVAAVEAAVASGREAAEKVGVVLSAHVIPRPHEEVKKMLEVFHSKKANKKKASESKTSDEEERK